MQFASTDHDVGGQVMEERTTGFVANYQSYSAFDVDLAKAALVIIDVCSTLR